MQPKSPSHRDGSPQTEKEQRIGEFIRQNVSECLGQVSIMLVVRSAASPVARAVNAVLGESHQRCAVRMIVIGDDWDAGVPATDQSAGEMRILRNPRLLHAHEQLVIGDKAT